MKWTHVRRLKFTIELVDGGRIGGSGGGLEIGGVDANLTAIRNPVNGQPYIPGSSLKGKLRSTLEKIYGKGQDGKPCRCGLVTCEVCPIFGAHMNPRSECAPTRIVVRDAQLSARSIEEWNKRSNEGLPVFELKTENIVDRKSGAAEHPRTGERVLPGSKFDGEILLHVYQGDKDEQQMKNILKGLHVIEEFSALGAGGSRGSGRVKFDSIKEEKIELAKV